MGDIIEFPKRTAAALSETNKERLEHYRENPPQNRHQYLKLCKETLTMDDYIDTLCGILDEEIYDFVEEPIKRIIDAYYKFTN